MGKRKNYRDAIKKYCLLENGSVEPCYYADGTLRTIYKDGLCWYIDHDVYAHQMIFYMHHRIVRFGDTADELLCPKKKNDKRQ